MKHLYDDQAASPLDAALAYTADKAKVVAESDVTATALKFATVGLYAGAAVGAFMLVTGICTGIVSSIFGSKDES